ncbi:targeting protein for Xklp2 [Kipferlia bialata]|uniref:Targeting protein for Xklp2 n=1 Tax=Kipferlia bialata TaxID=797122 RepID=A0A9K3CVJ1_9EUKA|nr:targeting protein for Xklp2 [Kipferlia bialata]|eukprot:g5538.t1
MAKGSRPRTPRKGKLGVHSEGGKKKRYMSRKELEEQVFGTNLRHYSPVVGFNDRLTRPIAPVLQTAGRGTVHQRKMERLRGEIKKRDEVVPFRARQLNRGLLEHTMGVAHVAPKDLTVPETPNITRVVRSEAKPDTPEYQFQARPLYVMDTPEVQRSDAPLTVPHPFELETDNRGESARERKRIMQQERERLAEKQARFVARPMVVGQSILPEVETRPPTKEEPFQLESVDRHYAKLDTFRGHVAEEEAQAEKARHFHARPVSAAVAAPFVPAKSGKKTTHTADVRLATEVRSQERQSYDEKRRQREQREREAAEQEQARQAALEEERLAQARKALEFKAKPAPKARAPAPIEKSHKKTTKAYTPRVARRSKMAKHKASP